MSQDIPSVSTTVALACVELFFNQVTAGGGDPVALHAKETKVIFSLNDTNTFFRWVEMVGTGGKLTEENLKKKENQLYERVLPIWGERKADMDFWIQHWMEHALWGGLRLKLHWVIL